MKVIAIEIGIDFHTVFWNTWYSKNSVLLASAEGWIILRDVPKQTENNNKYLNKLTTNILMGTTFYRGKFKIGRSNPGMEARLWLKLIWIRSLSADKAESVTSFSCWYGLHEWLEKLQLGKLCDMFWRKKEGGNDW